MFKSRCLLLAVKSDKLLPSLCLSFPSLMVRGTCTDSWEHSISLMPPRETCGHQVGARGLRRGPVLTCMNSALRPTGEHAHTCVHAQTCAHPRATLGCHTHSPAGSHALRGAPAHLPPHAQTRSRTAAGLSSAVSSGTPAPGLPCPESQPWARGLRQVLPAAP